MSGRPVKIRASYANDAAFLSRLMDAIERDPRRRGEWKQAVGRNIQALVNLFMEPITGEVTPDSTPPIATDEANVG